jgi:hypothetical protein
MKLTIQNISKALDETQDEYSNLFDDLILLKNFNSKRFHSKVVFEFQYKLGLRLYKLASLRNEIIVHERKLIDKKQLLNSNWFVQKMRLYKKFKESIDNCIDIGKTLGDAFVWHFYQFNLKELFKHCEHEENKIPPVGIGGIGELEFIKKYFIINDHFALLHGITNFLRVGDVSFISMKDFHLTSLGEIKTQRADKEYLTVNLTAIDSVNRKFFNNLKLEGVKERDIYKEYFNPGRLKRQVEKMKTILRPPKDDVKKSDDKLIYDNYYIKELEEAIDGVKGKIFNMKRVNPRLLFVANQITSKVFSKRMFEKENIKMFKKREKEISDEIITLFDMQNPNHSIQYGSLHFDTKLRPKTLIGTSPIFWYPIRPDILKDIYFQNVFVLSMFNPTQLFLDLGKKGLEFIRDEHTGKLFFGKKIGEKTLWFENLSYFLNLIKDHLQTEEAVITAIMQIVSLAESQKDLKMGLKIQPEIYHISRAYNQDNIE